MCPAYAQQKAVAADHVFRTSQLAQQLLYRRQTHNSRAGGTAAADREPEVAR
jgi:hypothetical protein